VRDGKPVHNPIGAIFGPKAMIINQSAGSGGDAMPWYFRKAKLGTLVGTRTWGGLIGIGGYPPLIDGGSVTAPRYAIYSLNGSFEVEGHGILPDIEVEDLPGDVAASHDAQLEKAVQVVIDQLKEHPVPEMSWKTQTAADRSFSRSKNRSINFVSNWPRRNSSSAKIFRCSGIVV
jgi:tricorn protease